MLRADMWTQVGGRGEWDELGDGIYIYTLPRVKQRAMEACCVAQGTQFRALW